jgi:hypothetical protein
MIEFEETRHDFGEVNQGERVVHHFIFRNEGDSTLTIEKVASSCGCAAALATTDEVQPGEQGEIKVTFNSSGYVGKVSKWVYVHSNDPNGEKVKLRITCTVVVDILVRPSAISFGKIQLGEPTSSKFTLLPMKLEKIEVKEVKVSSEHLTYRVSDYSDGGKDGYEIEVTLDSEMPVGDFTEIVKVHTNSEEHPVLSVNVRGQVRGDVWAEPEEIAFGCHRGKADTLEITVNKGSGSHFSIAKIDDNIEHVRSTFDLVREEEKRQIYRVIMRVDEDAPTGFVEETLDLYSPDGDEPIIRLPLYVFIH